MSYILEKCRDFSCSWNHLIKLPLYFECKLIIPVLKEEIFKM